MPVRLFEGTQCRVRSHFDAIQNRYACVDPHGAVSILEKRMSSVRDRSGSCTSGPTARA